MSLWKLITARWGSNSGETDEVRLDAVTNSLVGITFPHYQVHQGDSFISDYVDDSMGDNDTIIFAFKTPTGTKRAHMWVEFTTLVGGDMQIWESPTWTTNTGSTHSIINRKRETSMSSSMLLEDKTATPAFTATNNVLLNPTGLNTGSATSIHHFYAWGKKEKLNAGNVRDTEEFVLKPDTQYAIVFTAEGGSNKAQLILNWYEQTDSH